MRFLGLLATLSLAGCTEDVGDCFDDGKRGRDTVLDNGRVLYGGQAILNAACAGECHSSKATGKGRHGAPAGLDFDLEPVDAADSDSAENARGETYGKIDRDALAGLRARQRKVFEVRNLIWQQVSDGLMPPAGAYARFKSFTERLFDSDEDDACTRGAALKNTDTKSTQDVLRNWLACQVPIVEAYGGPVESDGTWGSTGYQYLACEGAPVGDASYDDVFTQVLNTCSGCHPKPYDDVDLSDPDSAFASLVGDTEPKCGDKPYVTPGAPDQSFLIDLVSLDVPCRTDSSIQRMPLGTPLSTSQVELLRAWIEAGAAR